MSKSDQNKAKQTAESDRAANNARMTGMDTTLQDILSGSRGTASSILPAVTAGYGDIMSSGGFSPAITGQIQGAYSNLMDNGGISAADATALRNRASRAAESTYQTASDQARRTAAATGGYGDVSAAVLGNLARTGSEAASRAVTDADASIVGLKQSGTIAGAQGMTSLQNSIVGNKLSAAGGMANIYGMNLNEANATVDSILRNYQQTGQLNQGDLQILTNLANQPGVFDKIVGTIGTLGGAAAGVLSGINMGKTGAKPAGRTY